MIPAVSGRLGDRLGSIGTKRTSFWASGRRKTLLYTHKGAPSPTRERAEEVPEIVSSRVKLEAKRVRVERAA